MKKKNDERLGDDPLAWVGDSRKKKKNDKPVKQQADKPTNKQERMSTSQHTNIKTGDALKRETFYIYPSQKRELKLLSIETGDDLSKLVRSALRDLFVKHS